MPQTDNGYERRRYFRVRPAMSQPVLMTMRVAGQDLQALPVKDISLGGIAFLCPVGITLPAIGTPILDLQLLLPNHGVITPIGVARRIARDAIKNKLYCALEFTNLSTNDDHKLFQYLVDRQRELLRIKTN